MNVYTYYEQVNELEDFHTLIDFWQEKWLEAGHTPCVLSTKDCDGVTYEQVTYHISKLPTVNPPQYELNNFLRWTAMDAITNKTGVGALHIDSDVFPNNFKDLPDFDRTLPTILQKDICPCGVWIPAAGCSDIIKCMYQYKKGVIMPQGEHCCDQEFFRWLVPQVKWLKVIDFIKSYKTEQDWEVGQMIHYPTANLPAGNKATTIRNLL